MTVWLEACSMIPSGSFTNNTRGITLKYVFYPSLMNMIIKVNLCSGDIKAICSCSYVVVYAALCFWLVFAVEITTNERLLKELRHDILSCLYGSLKIVFNWKETFK